MVIPEKLLEEWVRAKALERVCVEKRREAEDMIVKWREIVVDRDFVQRESYENYDLKITGRISRKVDSAKLQDIASEQGLTSHLNTLFRWKPDINMAIWKATDKKITDLLAGAITSTPGRPSFQITKKGE